jgi:RNA-directed DNA polymerase
VQIQTDIATLSKPLKHEVLALAFLQISSINDLRRLLRTEFSTLLECINNDLYTEFSISKKKGGTRLISAPQTPLIQTQNQLNNLLKAVYYSYKPACAHGFIYKPTDVNETHNIASNALPHVGRKFVMNIDLQDYFPSIKASRVRKLFKSKALLLTRNGSLPTGAPTSPVVANLITMPLDRELMKYCLINNIDYTRYADDLTFSTNEFITNETIAQIKAIIVKHKFTVNEKKFRIQSAMRQQKVTGLVVNQKVNVDRKYIKQIRAMLHHTKTEGVSSACAKHYKLKDIPTREEVLQFAYRLKGMIEFVSMVRGKEDAMVKRFKKEFNDFKFVI